MSRPAPGTGRRTGGPRLAVNAITCRAHGLCAELLPELITLDEWGYPILADSPVPPHLLTEAQDAVSACPTLALRLNRAG
jgi:ferredoxin